MTFPGTRRDRPRIGYGPPRSRPGMERTGLEQTATLSPPREADSLTGQARARPAAAVVARAGWPHSATPSRIPPRHLRLEDDPASASPFHSAATDLLASAPRSP